MTKNYKGTALTSRGAKIYNVLPLNRIEPEIEKILIKMRTAFGEIDPQHHRL